MRVAEVVRAEDAVLLHDTFVGGFDLGRGNHDRAWKSVTLDSNKFWLVLGVEEFVGVTETSDPLPVDFVDHRSVESGDEGSQSVAFNPGENHHVLALLEESVALSTPPQTLRGAKKFKLALFFYLRTFKVCTMQTLCPRVHNP